MALKLTQLASKPQLIKLTLNTESIVEKYGDELEFWIYDRQPIDQFIKMATAQQDDQSKMIKMVNDLILDEDGNQVMTNDNSLPNDVMIAVISAVVERLGK
jgi:hypothetical protein